MMSQQILVLVNKKGLSQNLLQLALSSVEIHAKFVDPRDIEKEGLKKFSHIIVDDSSVPTPEELGNLVGEMVTTSKIIYLTKNLEKEIKEFSPWTFLNKPFHPQELRSLLEGPEKKFSDEP